MRLGILQDADVAFASRRRRLRGAGERAMAKRTTHRSSKGTKLYAVRDKKGRFKDIQTYKRAHTADMRRKSKAEAASKAK
jgi:hypothetical protein